jgi:predicted nucleic acid-binding protein
MIIICDTSPLCYLLLIQQVEILPKLFGHVIIPNAVYEELLAEGADPVIQIWISQPPDWLGIQTVRNPLPNLSSKLGLGESEAITLAIELSANLVIIDDWEARQTAFSLGLTVTGLLGLLYRAGINDLLDFPEALIQLQRTTFRASAQLIEDFQRRYQNERRHKDVK